MVAHQADFNSDSPISQSIGNTDKSRSAHKSEYSDACNRTEFEHQVAAYSPFSHSQFQYYLLRVLLLRGGSVSYGGTSFSLWWLFYSSTASLMLCFKAFP